MSKEKTIEEIYVHLEHRDQILLRPDTTIGSIITEDRNMFVPDNILDLTNLHLENKDVKFNPGLFKIIDEILTNASDHFIRTGKVKNIKILIENDNITIENDGPGIPVVIHKKEKMYVPELLFGNTFTSENYNDSIKRTWGGRNGIGSKATNIFSKKFLIETSDGEKKYYQEFNNNMSKKSKPVITNSKKNYTKIQFYPDLERFGLTEIDDDMKLIILRRCIDISVYCQGVKVFFNENIIPVKSFKDYMKLFTEENDELFSEKLNEYWEIGLCKSIDNSFNQISMVNGISTYKGGTHVNSIINQITKNVQDILLKRYKKLNIKQNDIKNRLFLFVNLKIENPTFDEQSKETLTVRLSPPPISDNLIKKITSSNIIEELVKFLEIKDEHDTKKEVSKSKIKINKLDDAKKAGTSESDKCLIFMSEGDSSHSSVIAGLSANDTNYIGVFPLKGKPLNVRDVELSKIRTNDEIKNIINILGLEFGKKYTDTKKLRYGKVVLMADADCIDENTLILTKRGHVPIKEVTYDDEVLTHTGKWKKILNIIKTEKKNVIKITINNEEYTFGENHEIPIIREGEIILTKAKNILRSDKILIRKF